MKFNEQHLPVCKLQYGNKISKIIDTVNDFYNYEPLGDRGSQNVKQRQIIHYLCKTLTKAPLWYIGYMAGGRDHATVLNSYKKTLNYIETESIYREELEAIEKRLNDVRTVLFLTNNKFLLNRFIKVC